MPTILNIQHDEHTARLMSWILEENRYIVVGVREVSEVGAATTADVIIVDTNVPATDTPACIATLRRLVPKARIIELGVGVESPQHDTGADRYLNMPFDAYDLLARVHE